MCIRDSPTTRFAAEFIGQSNFLRCEVVEAENATPILSYAGRRFPGRAGGPELRAGDEVEVCLRLERVRLSRAPMGPCSLPGVLKSRHYAGGSIRETVALSGGQEVLAIQQSSGEERLEEGEQVYVSWNPNEAALVR